MFHETPQTTILSNSCPSLYTTKQIQVDSYAQYDHHWKEVSGIKE